MPKVFIRFHLCACALLASAALRAEPAVIALARAYLGPDSTLDSIQSIHFIGVLDRADPEHPDAPPIHAALDMTFAKPLRQRQVVTLEKVSETTVLDGYDAWERVQDRADPGKFRMKWLSASDIRGLRANTWENLFFYRGLDVSATLEDMGPATVDGIACERIDFHHGPDNVFERFFDRDTGRLVVTVHETETIRESGQILVNSVRFPKSIVSVTRTASGRDVVSTVTFSSISLNERLGADVFAVPSTLPAEGETTAAEPPGK